MFDSNNSKINITFHYKYTCISADIEKTKQISYLKEKAYEIFHPVKYALQLVYKDKDLTPYENLQIGNFFSGRNSPVIKVRDKEKSQSLIQIQNCMMTRKLDCSAFETSSDNSVMMVLPEVNKSYEQMEVTKKILTKKKSKSVKQNPASRLICTKCFNEMISYYCRDCNSFFCKFCKVQLNIEHFRHKVIQISNEDLTKSAKVYYQLIKSDIANNQQLYKKNKDYMAKARSFDISLKKENMKIKLDQIDQLHQKLSQKGNAMLSINSTDFEKIYHKSIKAVDSIKIDPINEENIVQQFTTLNQKEKELKSALRDADSFTQQLEITKKINNILSVLDREIDEVLSVQQQLIQEKGKEEEEEEEEEVKENEKEKEKEKEKEMEKEKELEKEQSRKTRKEDTEKKIMVDIQKTVSNKLIEDIPTVKEAENDLGENKIIFKEIKDISTDHIQKIESEESPKLKDEISPNDDNNSKKLPEIKNQAEDIVPSNEKSPPKEIITIIPLKTPEEQKIIPIRSAYPNHKYTIKPDEEEESALNNNNNTYKKIELTEDAEEKQRIFKRSSIIIPTKILNGEEVKEKERRIYQKILVDSFDKVSPLIYLTPEQRLGITEGIRYVRYDKRSLLYSGLKKVSNEDSSAYILLSGEAHFFGNNGEFQDLIQKIHFFGHDGPIFNKRVGTVFIERDSVLGVIPEQVFLQYLHPYSKFCTFISRTIMYKDKVLDDLNTLKNYILSSTDTGYLDIKKLISLYKKINPCLHPYLNQSDLDISAWTYALNRLPQSVLETYSYILINKPPKMLCLGPKITDQIIPNVKSNARQREVYQYLHGKNVVIVREMESDIFDFISNMCVHIVESTKLRHFIYTPITFDALLNAKGNFDNTIEILQKAIGKTISSVECEYIKKYFGNQLADKLIDVCLHYQNYSLQIVKLPSNDLDSVEKWIQNLWNVVKKILGVNSTVDEIEDLVVDIFQGSKRTLLGCISPHLHKNKNEIIQWGVKNKILLKTKEFFNEDDKLLAYAYYYYKEFPEKMKEREDMEREHGIFTIQQTFATGVQVLVVNTSKLDPQYMDSSIQFRPASKHHILLHIGYTFGAQSSNIIKPLLMLFGSKARSMNTMAKAEGLVGERSDILVASKIIHDKTNELVNVNYGSIDAKRLEAHTKSNIHIGPMLTVGGTILQNRDLLNFYKYVMGCIGIDMEGYFFALEIENAIKENLVDSQFITRCFYYVSELPLDQSQSLAQDKTNVSWDEGIGAMNAIQRYVLQQVFSK